MNSGDYVSFLTDTGDKFRRLHSAPIHLNQLYLQHDNARPHVSRETSSFLERRGVSLVKQSPYSPDMNICDRWLNSKLEDSIRKGHFDDADSVATAALLYMRSIPEEEYFEQVRKLERHCQRIIDANGSYITD